MSVFGTIKNLIGIGNDDDFDEEYYDDEEGYEEEETPPKKTASAFKRQHSKVVPINPNNTARRMCISKPETFNDSTTVVELVKREKFIILDLVGVDKSEQRRIVDFVSGALYALEGSIKRVEEGIFAVSPIKDDIDESLFKARGRSAADWNVE